MKSKGAKFQIVKFDPETNIGPHYHKKTIEIYVIKQGEGIFTFNDKKYVGKEGDVFVIEREDVHSLRNIGYLPLEILIYKTNEQKNDTYWGKNVEI